MPEATDLRRALYKATEQFLVGDAPALADELTDALLANSAGVARIRKSIAAGDPVAAEVLAVDEAFGRSVTLARKLSSAIRSYDDPGGYVAVAPLVRDLGRHLASSMPGGVAFTVRVGTSHAIAAMPSSELRSVLAKLIRRTYEGVLDGREFVLEVLDGQGADASVPEVHIILGHGALTAGTAADAADQVRDAVNARGGWVAPCATAGRGATVVVSLPSPC
jgi:hypothetical protein